MKEPDFHFKHMRLSKQLWLLSIASMVVLLTIFSFSYYYISRVITNNNINYTSELLSQVQKSTEDTCSSLEGLLVSMGYNRPVCEFLMQKDSDENFDMIQNLDSIFYNISDVNPYVKDIVLLGKGDQKYYKNGSTIQKDAFFSHLPQEPNYYYSYPYTFSSGEQPSFTLSTAVYNVFNRSWNEYLGSISFLVDYGVFHINTLKTSFDTGVYLVGENDGLIYSTNKRVGTKTDTYLLDCVKKTKLKKGQTQIVVNGEHYIINFASVPKIHMRVVTITAKSAVEKSVAYIRWITYTGILLAVILFLILFGLFIQHTTAPLSAFKSFMMEMKDGKIRNLKKRIHLTGFHEMEEISNGFNEMFDEVDSLTHRLVNTTTHLYELELEKNKAELNHLKSQINPHFLYNTLEVIIGMSLEENAPQTTEMIKSLSKIFKYSVRGEDMASVQDELATVKAYIYIQKMRFYDAFEVVYDIDERVLDKKIPKMILQPIVENAIIHGIEETEKKATLVVGANYVKNHLMLWVEDNGAGMDEKTLSHLRHLIKGEDISPTESIGTLNVINRLRLIYNQDFTMTIDSRLGIGTKIMITIDETKREEGFYVSRHTDR